MYISPVIDIHFNVFSLYQMCDPVKLFPYQIQIRMQFVQMTCQPFNCRNPKASLHVFYNTSVFSQLCTGVALN